MRRVYKEIIYVLASIMRRVYMRPGEYHEESA